MAIALPTNPAPREASPRLITARNELRSAFGGSTQRINRLGSRWAIDITMPPMEYATAMAWAALLEEADTAVMRIYQPGFDTGSPGTPRVKGAGQTGNVLVVDGLTNGYVLKAGQFLSVIISGQRFAYQVRADVTVASGEAAIPIRPLIRKSPADNAVVEIADPMIEGFVTVPDGAFAIDGNRHVAGLSFTIEERE